MTSSTPTAASAMIDLADLAAQAAAGPDVLAYLKARGIDRTATLALIASAEDAFIRAVADPFVNGHAVGGTTHKAKDGEGDIARAIMLHMWMEAKRQWQARVAVPTPSPSTPATTTTTSTTSSSTDEKPPKHFTAWAQCVENYNAKLLDGKRRRFPTNMLVGAEEVLARLYHEHTKSKLYTPLGLGKILSRRTFTPGKSMNPLAQMRAANAASAVQALRLEHGELASSKPEWMPRSMIAVMDGADAAKEDVEQYVEWYKAKARSRPDALQQVHDYYWYACAWRIALAMRLGTSFADITRNIMADVTAFQEAVLAGLTPQTIGQRWTSEHPQRDGGDA